MTYLINYPILFYLLYPLKDIFTRLKKKTL